MGAAQPGWGARIGVGRGRSAPATAGVDARHGRPAAWRADQLAVLCGCPGAARRRLTRPAPAACAFGTLVAEWRAPMSLRALAPHALAVALLLLATACQGQSPPSTPTVAGPAPSPAAASPRPSPSPGVAVASPIASPSPSPSPAAAA